MEATRIVGSTTREQNIIKATQSQGGARDGSPRNLFPTEGTNSQLKRSCLSLAEKEPANQGVEFRNVSVGSAAE
jgi:hypothetical protein